MSEERSEELEAIAEEVQHGRDRIAVPEQLLAEPAPQDEETKSLYARIKEMSVGQRIKLALKGNRDARILLIRDSNRLVQRFVLQNPRISDDEIIMVCKNRNTDTELLRVIAENRDWSHNSQVKQALVHNPKTPLTTSLPLVGSIGERELRLLAKNKNVPSTIASRARRLLVERYEKK